MTENRTPADKEQQTFVSSYLGLQCRHSWLWTKGGRVFPQELDMPRHNRRLWFRARSLGVLAVTVEGAIRCVACRTLVLGQLLSADCTAAGGDGRELCFGLARRAALGLSAPTPGTPPPPSSPIHGSATTPAPAPAPPAPWPVCAAMRACSSSSLVHVVHRTTTNSFS